jgi:hypothetical protein
MQHFGSWRRPLGVIALGLACAAAPFDAQDTTGWSPRGWIAAFSVGLPGIGDSYSPLLFTVGGTFTQDRPNSLALDAAIGTAPYVIAYGVVPVGARMGIALPLEVQPGLTLVPSAGASFIGTASGDAGTVGRNAGFAFLTRVPDGSGVRVGATWHLFENDRQPFWLFELGILRANRKAGAPAKRTPAG